MYVITENEQNYHYQVIENIMLYKTRHKPSNSTGFEWKTPRYIKEVPKFLVESKGWISPLWYIFLNDSTIPKMVSILSYQSQNVINPDGSAVLNSDRDVKPHTYG